MQGLNQTEVEENRRRFGSNLIPGGKRLVWLRILLSQFKSPLVYILLVAAVITYFLGEYVDMGVILVAVIVNTLLGFFQEYRAEKSLFALKKILTPKVLVIREGREKEILVDEVVVGDIVFMSDLHKVAADGVVLEEDSLFCDESILTGESVSVEKMDYPLTDNMDTGSLVIELRKSFDNVENKFKVSMGTKVEVGVGKMLVLRVGQETEMGKIALSLKESRTELTPLQKNVKQLASYLAALVIVTSVAVLVVGLVVGDSFVEIFPTTVALAVGAIPEGLLVSLTVILAIGMQRILKQRAVVRELTSAETLGSVNVICADKTGTLTEGVMRVTGSLLDLNGKESSTLKENLFKAAILCNDGRDPLEVGMRKWAERENGSEKVEMWRRRFERVDSIPFSSKYRFIATLHKDGEKRLLFMSGAPETILERCKMTASKKLLWEEKFRELASRGHRLIGFGEREMKGRRSKVEESDLSHLVWLGILVYEDPVREGVAGLIKQLQEANIKVKVITGDYVETAAAVLRQIGLLKSGEGEKMMSGDDLEGLADEELDDRIEGIVLFARTKPDQKLRIVESLQRKGLVVAMTGDGVNDAPALAKADIGIVVEGASDVAKETADLVLLDNNFATIVHAIEEGRGIFDNLKKIIIYLLSDAFAEIMVVIVSLVLRWPLPILATQILWINLVSDGFPNLALTMEPKEAGLLKQLPKKRGGRLIDGEVLLLIALISVAAAVMTLLAFGYFWGNVKYGLMEARTVAFTMLGVSSLFYVFSSRSISLPIWKVNLFRNWWLIGGVVMGMAMQLAVIYVPILQRIFGTTPLDLRQWLVILAGSAVLMTLVEGVKSVYGKRR